VVGIRWRDGKAWRGSGPSPGVVAALRSMTGFGRGSAGASGRTLAVEARSVNHRYLDLALRLPREYGSFEERLRGLVRGRIRRGRVDLVLAAGPGPAPGRGLVVDTALAAQYHQALRNLAARLGVPIGLDAAALAALPGVCGLSEEPGDPEGDWPLVAIAAQQALDGLDAMRAREGATLAAALAAALGTVGAQLRAAEARAPLAAGERLAALRERLQAALGQASAGGAPAELWGLLERADIREELVRLGSHLAQAQACLESAEPVGRVLDFLAQEMQREWSTIAAKAVDAELAERAVLARVAVEQIREQVQNVE